MRYFVTFQNGKKIIATGIESAYQGTASGKPSDKNVTTLWTCLHLQTLREVFCCRVGCFVVKSVVSKGASLATEN